MNTIFGTFEHEEFKKFVRMGTIFSLILASCWTLMTLKNAIFCTLISAAQIPWAKTGSLLLLIPALIIYNKLLERYKPNIVFYLVTGVYAFIFLIFSILIMQTPCHKNIGYMFFAFVENYIALIPAIFWAIASDTTTPDSAKKGYSLIMAIGQLGGIIGPYFINSLPRRLGFVTPAVSIFICIFIILLSQILLDRFFKKTPKNLLKGYPSSRISASGLLEGLVLLLKSKYLLGIFTIIIFPEILTTIFDLHFNYLASQKYTGIDLVEYLGKYGSSINIFAFLFLILGIGNITRIWGIGVSLVLMPIIYCFAITGFITLNSLTFLFILMSCSKAINYALNVPAIKQLYIPTTHDVRFKAQSWIESFGLLGAKQAGSIFNMYLDYLGSTRHALLSGYLGFFITFIWVFVAIFLNKKYKEAIAENKVIV